MLGRCRGCLRGVPTEATKCPHCGYPYPTYFIYSPVILIGWALNKFIPIFKGWIKKCFDKQDTGSDPD